jgi:hypothetical protein
MNDWTAPSDPHTDHPHFPFDDKNNNPCDWKEGKWHFGKKPPKRVDSPSNAKEQFEAMCATLLELIDQFNLVTRDCKAAATENAQQIATAKAAYTTVVNNLNQFMGRTPDVKAGYEDFLKPGSFKIEVVLSSGFVTGARIFGLSLFTSSSSSYYSTNPKRG